MSDPTNGAGGLGAYRTLLTRPHVARFLAGGVIAQFPYAMVNMALLIGVRDGYGSYSSAGVTAAITAVAGAIIGPSIGRRIDRFGQRRVGSVIGAFWIASMCALGVVLWMRPPCWTLIVVAVALGASVPGGSLVRARWRLALAEDPLLMPAALSLTSVAEESMWVLSTPIATALATLISPLAALAFAVVTILVGLHLLLGDDTFEPTPLVSADRGSARTGGAEGEAASMALSNGRRAALPKRQERLWIAAFAVLLSVLVFYGAFQSTTGVAIVAFAQERDAQAWAGTVSACFSGGSLIGALVYGARDWTGPLWARFYIGLGALALGCSGLVLVDSMAAAGMVMFVSGMFQAPTIVNINQIFMRIVPASRFTEGMALFGSMWVIGMSLSNIVAGVVIDRYGAAGGFGTVVGFAFVAVVLAFASMPSVRRALCRFPHIVPPADAATRAN